MKGPNIDTECHSSRNLSKPSSKEFDKDTIEYLSDEITYLQTELERPGWTRWALLASIATIFWLLLAEAEASPPSFINVGLIFLSSSLFLDAAMVLRTLLPQSLHPSIVPGRFHITNELFSSNRTFFLLLAVRWMSAIYIGVLLIPIGWPLASILLFIIDGFLVLIMLIFIVLSFYRWPLPTKARSNQVWLRILVFFIFTGSVLGFSIYSRGLFYLNPSVSLDDIRFSVLVISAFVLLLIFSRLPGGGHLLNSLVHIRRDLALGRISGQFALEQADIALAGARASDVLQEHIAAALDLLSRFASHHKEILKEIDALEALWSQSDDQLSSEQETIANSIRRSSMVRLVEAYKIMNDEIPSVLPHLYSRLNIMEFASAEPSYEISEIKSKLSASWDHADEMCKEAFVRMEEFIRTTEGDEALKEYRDELGRSSTE